MTSKGEKTYTRSVWRPCAQCARARVQWQQTRAQSCWEQRRRAVAVRSWRRWRRGEKKMTWRPATTTTARGETTPTWSWWEGGSDPTYRSVPRRRASAANFGSRSRPPIDGSQLLPTSNTHTMKQGGPCQDSTFFPSIVRWVSCSSLCVCRSAIAVASGGGRAGSFRVC